MGGSGSRQEMLAGEEAQYIKQTIQDNCIVIFSKTTCSYSRMAKHVFEGMGTPYHCVELNSIQGGDRIQEVLGQMTGQRTVPRVFVNGQCIGGGTETKTLHNQGKLATMIQQCGDAAKL